MRALILDSTSEPLTVRTVPTPQPGPGSAVVRILAASVVPYARDVYNGERNYAFPTPLIPGGSAIGRIAAVGPDATTLKTGDLVLMDPNIRGRDGSTDIMLLGLHEGFTDGSRKLMRGEWRNSTDAEYCKMPLENLALLNEKILLSSGEDGGLGYTVEDLSFLRTLLVPYGGLRDIDLKVRLKSTTFCEKKLTYNPSHLKGRRNRHYQPCYRFFRRRSNPRCTGNGGARHSYGPQRLCARGN